MGLPLGPTFANIFMCAHEEKWFVDCPVALSLCFIGVMLMILLYHHKSIIKKQVSNKNSKHDRINFTMECESDNKLAFLD